MAQDPTTSDVSTPEGGVYPSSEEVRASDTGTREEIINEFGDVIGNELLDAGILSFSGLMIIDDEMKDSLSPEAKELVETYFTTKEGGPTAIEVADDQNDNPVEEDEIVEEATEAEVAEVAEVTEEVPADAGGGEEETDVESEVSEEEAEEEAEGETPEEESVSEGDGDEEADSGEGAPEEAVAEGEAAEEADTAGDVEEPVEEDDESVDEVEEGLDEHEHEVPSPMSYQEAKDKLEEIPYQELREMAEADGLKPERSKKGVIIQLLSAWFPAPPQPAEEQQMSVRVRRIKESQSQ